MSDKPEYIDLTYLEYQIAEFRALIDVATGLITDIESTLAEYREELEEGEILILREKIKYWKDTRREYEGHVKTLESYKHHLLRYEEAVTIMNTAYLKGDIYRLSLKNNGKQVYQYQTESRFDIDRMEKALKSSGCKHWKTEKDSDGDFLLAFTANSQTEEKMKAPPVLESKKRRAKKPAPVKTQVKPQSKQRVLGSIGKWKNESSRRP